MVLLQLSNRRQNNVVLLKFLIIYSISLIAGISDLSASSPDSTQKEVLFQHWLSAGPIEVAIPAFYKEKNLEGKPFKVEDFLRSGLKKVEQPTDGSLFLKQENNLIDWEIHKTNKTGDLFIHKPQNGNYALNWQASYLQTDSYISVTMEIETPQCFVLFVDGERKLSKLSFTEDGKDPGSKKEKLELEPGKHLIVIVSLFKSNEDENWKILTKIVTGQTNNFRLHLNPEEFMNMKLLLDGQRLKGTLLSPDGKYILLRFNEVFPPDGESENWFEIQDRENKNMIFSSLGREMKQVKWAPTGHQISYVSKLAGLNTIEILDLDNYSNKVLHRSKKDFESYTWAMDGTFLIYSITEEPKEKEKDVYRLEGMSDRWPWWRKRSQLFKLNIEDLSVQRLTYGHLSNYLHDIRPDGKKLIISQDFPDFSERPYSKQVLMELNLSDLSVDTIWEKHYGGSTSYSPDGKKLLVTGSPVLFGELGKNIKGDNIPNDYDTQAYIYDLKSTDVKPISKDFKPSIMHAHWNTNDGHIYFIGQDRTFRKVYGFNPKSNTFSVFDTKVDIVKNIDFSRTNDFMIYTGNSISYPSVCYEYNLKTKLQLEIANPEKSVFENVKFGKTEEWNFNNESGITIEGRVYYPPDFNPKRKYPLIVYYYAGTSPTNRSFRGRYPKNLFAAMGYIVYVLQPSGATGYGQEFSAKHVNNWGITVADEIISGTKLFLKDHPFVDPENIGCLGASYGGFMTMLLTTRTDIFAAAISHAGISSISSYWGEGFWGYSYSSAASANSFPWNNRELYIDQSPLFNADKVTTPLLLLHGDADTNVPPGESIQMYTALKLLGKKVELVQVEGQNHHITNYKKRIKWQKTIFAWFDKWLKEESSWWDALYPEKDL